MRLLHTSDWHLGLSLHQFDRRHEHDKFFAGFPNSKFIRHCRVSRSSALPTPTTQPACLSPTALLLH